jgi:antitoxin component YwqK of YwqJK toxin-antitoxin module
MKRISLFLIAFAIIVRTVSAAQPTYTVKSAYDKNRKLIYTFYKDRNEIAKCEWVKSKPLKLLSGAIEDGIYKEVSETAVHQKYIPFKDNDVNGNVLIYFAPGQLYREIPYKNGIKNGLMKSFNKSGVLILERSYKNGILDGICRMYCPGNGKIEAEVLFDNGKLKTREEFPENEESSQDNSSRPSMLPDSGASLIENSAAYAMFGHLANITDAKAHWARRYDKPEGSVPTSLEVGQFIKGGFPSPPLPGKYILNPVGQSPEFRMPFDEFFPFFRARETQIRNRAEHIGAP